MDNTPFSFKWGTAPPVHDAQGRTVRAFGVVSAQVLDEAAWNAVCAAYEDTTQHLRGMLTQVFQACLTEYGGDLPAFSLIVQSRASGAFQELGLVLTHLEIQSLENGDIQSEPAFRDPLPNPADAFPNLSLGMFGLNYPVDDIRITPPDKTEESDES